MQLTPEATIGLIASFGISILAILMLLKRFGIIKFGNGAHCPDHDAFCKSFKTVRDEHLLQGQTLENHEKRLDEGKVIFNEIKEDVGEIKADIKLIKFKLEIEEGI